MAATIATIHAVIETTLVAVIARVLLVETVIAIALAVNDPILVEDIVGIVLVESEAQHLVVNDQNDQILVAANAPAANATTIAANAVVDIAEIALVENDLALLVVNDQNDPAQDQSHLDTVVEIHRHAIVADSGTIVVQPAVAVEDSAAVEDAAAQAAADVDVAAEVVTDQR